MPSSWPGARDTLSSRLGNTPVPLLPWALTDRATPGLTVRAVRAALHAVATPFGSRPCAGPRSPERPVL